MMTNLFQYYGSDLVGTVFILLSIYFIGSKKRVGFILGVIGNLSWIFFSILTQSMPLILTNVILVLFNTRGFMKWEKDNI